MALIYTYPRLTTVANDDLFVITDFDGSNTNVKPTKSVTFATIKQAIAGSVTVDYIPVSDGSAFVDSVMFQQPGTAYGTTKNVIIGGNIYQSDMGNSVSIGQNALANGVDGTDGENVAIGQNALNALTTGTNNVAIGSSTLLLGQTVLNNIAISKLALQNLSSGLGNISLGFNTLSNVATANRNVVIGHLATQNNTSGAGGYQNNIILGASALANGAVANTIQRNVIIGESAGQNISASNLDMGVFIGFNAGQSLQGNSIDDIGIGRGAFFGNNLFVSAGNNIAIGRQANGNNPQNNIEGSIRIGGDAGNANSFAVNIGTVSTAIGQANDALGSHSALIGGYNNSVSSQAGFIGAGHDNTVSANATGGAILGGYDNIINGTGSAGMALGSDLIVDGNNQVVVGRYNEANNNTKFVVGCGSSNAARQNGFEVLNTGQLRATFYGGSNFPAPGNYKFLVAGSTGNILQVDDSAIEESELNVTNISRDIGTSYFTGPTPPLNIKFTRLAGGAGTIEVVINSSFPTNRLLKFISDGSFAANEGLLIRAAGGENINGQANKTVLGPYKTVQLWFDGSEYFVLYEN